MIEQEETDNLFVDINLESSGMFLKYRVTLREKMSWGSPRVGSSYNSGYDSYAIFLWTAKYKASRMLQKERKLRALRDKVRNFETIKVTE